jgi:hypothetical protein
MNVDYSCPASGSGVRVLKPHGSCNFYSVDLTKWRSQLTTAASSLECDFDASDPAMASLMTKSKFSDIHGAYFPIISLCTPPKNTILAPAKIQRIRNEWAERVAEASRIVVIGVKPNPLDDHVWDPILSNRSPNAFYIGSRSDLGSWPEVNCRMQFVNETFASGLPKLGTLL